MWLCLCSLLVLYPVDAISSGYGGSEGSDDNGFHRGGTQPRCWIAADSISYNEGNSPLAAEQATSITFLDSCPDQTSLEVRVNLDEKNNKSSQPPGSWKLQVGNDMHVTVRGSMEQFTNTSEAVVVLQLCPIGLNTLCVPVVPPRQSFRRLTDEPRGPYVPLINSTVTFREDVTEEEFESGVELKLEMTSSDTFSIVASILFINSTNHIIMAATNIPEYLSEQMVTVFDTEPIAVQKPSWVTVVVLSVIGSTILLYLLWHTIQIRTAQVFELSQGKFLVAMLFSGAISTSSLVLFEPKNDLYCKLWQPLIILPLHIMYAILLGRMWRIRAVISPLLLLTLEKKEHWSTKIVNIVNRFTRWGFLHQGNCSCLLNDSDFKPSTKKIRRTITDLQLTRVILWLCLPQLIIQLVMLVAYSDNQVIIWTDDDFPQGFEICMYRFDNSVGQSLSIVFLGVLFFMLLVLARGSQDLPSLFNETENILDVAWVTMSMTAGGLVLALATRKEDTTPDIRFLTKSIILGVTTVYTCFKITWPKLIMAWSGSKVLVTKLIADHNFKKNRGDPYNVMTTRADPYSVTATQGDPTSFTYSGSHYNAKARHSNRISATKPYGTSPAASALPTPTAVPSVDTAVHLASSEFDGNILDMSENLEDASETLNDEEQDDDGNETTSTQSSVILIDEDEALDSFPEEEHYESIVDLSGLHFDSTDIGSVHTSSTPNSHGWLRNALSRNFGFSSRHMSTGEQSTHLQPSTPLGGRGVLAKSRTPPISHHSRNSMATSNAPSFRSNATSVGLRRKKQSIVHNTGLYTVRQRRSSIVGGRARISIFGGGAQAATSATPSHLKNIGYNPKRSDDKIRISETEPPGRRLLLRMVDVQRMLTKVNQALLTGLSIDRDDWEEIREGCAGLGDAFTSEVVFAWEEHLVRHDDEAPPIGPITKKFSNPVHRKDSAKAPKPLTKKMSWDPNVLSPEYRKKKLPQNQFRNNTSGTEVAGKKDDSCKSVNFSDCTEKSLEGELVGSKKNDDSFHDSVKSVTFSDFTEDEMVGSKETGKPRGSEAGEGNDESIAVASLGEKDKIKDDDGFNELRNPESQRQARLFATPRGPESPTRARKSSMETPRRVSPVATASITSMESPTRDYRGTTVTARAETTSLEAPKRVFTAIPELPVNPPSPPPPPPPTASALLSDSIRRQSDGVLGAALPAHSELTPEGELWDFSESSV